MVLGLAAALGAVLVHSEGETGHRFCDNPDAGVDRGELDRGLRIDGFAGPACTEVEGWGCADGVLGLVTSAKKAGEGVFHRNLHMTVC